MSLVRRNELFPTWSNFWNDFFSRDWNDWSLKNYSDTNTTLPSVNIKENDDGFEVEVAAPGMEKKDFNIELKNDLLTISSEKKVETQDTDDNEYTRREFSYQSFSRSFTLPNTIDDKKIKAKYENGILKVQIPKKEEAKPKPPKKIAIS